MERLFQDFKYSLRHLGRNPGFTVVVVLTLALGIGANAAIFSVIDGVLLEPLPFTRSRDLVLLGHNYPKLNLQASTSALGFTIYREQASSFSEMGSIGGWSANLTGEGEPERLVGARITPSFLPTLKVEPVKGRNFEEGVEDVPGQDNVVLISDGLWQRRFANDPQIVGRRILVNGIQHEVVGVLPPGFKLNTEYDVYAPLAFTSQQLDPSAMTNEFLTTIARLEDGSTLQQAQTEMDGIATRLLQQYEPTLTPADWGIWIEPMREALFGSARPALYILAGAVAFVLLIACTNVANLLLARATARERELAVRTALGAGRGRLVRQLLTESVLLALAGGTAGVFLALWGVDALLALNPVGAPELVDIGVDGSVLLFTLAISLLTGVIFGLLPALQVARPRVQEVLKDGGRGSTTGSGRNNLRKALVISEVALALMLLVGAGLMIRSFRAAQRADTGFSPEQVLTFQVSLPAATYGTPVSRVNFFEQLVQRLEATPGITRAGAVNNVPFSGSVNTGSYQIENYMPPEGTPDPHGDIRYATPSYFDAMGIRLLEGRLFEAGDREGTLPVIVVDEELAARYFPNESALGKRINRNGGENPQWFQIVGVVSHVLQDGIKGERRTQLYYSQSQVPVSRMTVAVKVSGSSPASAASTAKAAVASLDRDLPVYSIRPMAEYAYSALAPERFVALLLLVFAGSALLLAGVGIYGVMSYAVLQRTHEMGVRMALGAASSAVRSLVIRQGMSLTVVGVLLGAVGAFALTRLVSGLLYGVSATDPWTFASVAILLTAVAFLATWVPALRATRVDPMIALRQD